MANVERQGASETPAKAADGWLSKFKEYVKLRKKRDNWSWVTNLGAITLGAGIAGLLFPFSAPVVISLLAAGGAGSIIGAIGETRQYSRMKNLETNLAK